MKVTYLCIILGTMLLFTVVSCAQTGSGIIKATFYQQEISGGNIPIDMDGKQMHKTADTSFFIVIETKSSQLPKLEKIYRNGTAYHLMLTDSTQGNQTELMAARGQIINVAKGNRLWRYTLSIADDNTTIVDTFNNAILLKVKYKGKNITIPVKDIITLDPEMRP